MHDINCKRRNYENVRKKKHLKKREVVFIIDKGSICREIKNLIVIKTNYVLDNAPSVMKPIDKRNLF